MTIEVAPRHSLFHLEAPRFKHEENSHRGDLEAKRRGFKWTDHDEQLDADGFSWNTHWRCPMVHDGFIDPLGRIDPDTPISKLRSEQVARLRTRHGNYKIRPSIHRVEHALELGLGVEHECKSPHYNEAYFRKLKMHVGARNLDMLWIKAYPQFAHSLVAAARVGLTTVILSHGHSVAEEYAPFIRYRRGGIHFV